MSTEFSKGQKWSFGMGSFAQWFINSAFNIWVFTYYFTVVGLDVRWYMLAAVLWTCFFFNRLWRLRELRQVSVS